MIYYNVTGIKKIKEFPKYTVYCVSFHRHTNAKKKGEKQAILQNWRDMFSKSQ